MNPVIHFEMPARDKDRVSRFYTEAFGWGMQKLGPEMGEYVLATTTEVGEDMRPRNPGAINGGFFTRDEGKPDQYPSVVIGVGDVQEAMGKVRSAGGEVLGEPVEIPGVGLYVSFRDTEGNRVGMLQPAGM